MAAHLKGKNDLFVAGTYKISDDTMVFQGSTQKVKALKTYDTCTITSGKFINHAGEEEALATKYLTVALADGTDIVFPGALHEIILAGSPGSALLIFD